MDLMVWVSCMAVAWGLVWLYSYITCGVCRSKVDMYDKVVIITGATSGEIVRITQNFNVAVYHLDVSLMSSVRKFVKQFRQMYCTLDVLIHNAGVQRPPRVVTEEGLHTTWATNHFGPFLLTYLLVDLLKKTKNSRVVVVSSFLHQFGRIDLNNLNPLDQPQQYINTKLANVLFTNELARRLKPWGVTANSLHPGCIPTNIWEGAPLLFRLYLYCSRPFLKTAEQGAQTTIYLAVSEEVKGVTGKYFCDCKESSACTTSQDEELAKSLWERSEKITRMTPADPHI